MGIIEVVQVTKYFRGVRALDACSFSIAQHGITGLIGPNGSGKTTLLNLVTGYEHVDAGDIILDGTSLSNLTIDQVVRVGVTRTFQHSRIFPRLTVWEHMQLALPTSKLLDLFRWECSVTEQQRALELLEFVGIAKLKHEAAGNLSYGQKKLLELACTLLTEPQVLLLDEPTGGIHPKLIASMSACIRQLHAQGLTIVIVEHNIDFIFQLCAQVIVLNRGAVIASGTPEQVYADRAVRESYLGKTKV